MIKATTPQLLFTLLCIGSMFFYSQQFTDSHIVTKWYCSMTVVLIGTMYFSIKAFFCKPTKINIAIWGIIISLTCLLQAIYGIAQYFSVFSSSSIYKVTGSFDNPAGFAACLSVGLVFTGMLLSDGKNRYIQYAGWSIGIIITAAVILSESRAGIISIFTIGCIFIWRQFKLKRLHKTLLFGSFLLLSTGGYWIKKDSADGRLLIWQCGMDMVEDTPWLGHGTGGFEAHYMDYQAAYFRKYPQSRYSMLAGNVKQPFNEYLGILLNYGIIGLLALFTMAGFLVYCYWKQPDNEKKIVLYSFLSIGVFALFSYPFTYPFVWVVIFFNIYVLTRGYFCRFSSAWIRKISCFFILVCSLFFSYQLAHRILHEKEWGKISKIALCGHTEEVLPHYRKLKCTFSNNPYFLYNYAIVCAGNKQYDESLRIALQCRYYWADYDLELMIGEIYEHQNKLVFAEKYYCSAAMMCPSRFTPLYFLFKLYKRTGDINRAQEVAKAIIDKPVKIKSFEILRMKREMRLETESLSE